MGSQHYFCGLCRDSCPVQCQGQGHSGQTQLNRRGALSIKGTEHVCSVDSPRQTPWVYFSRTFVWVWPFLLRRARLLPKNGCLLAEMICFWERGLSELKLLTEPCTCWISRVYSHPTHCGWRGTAAPGICWACTATHLMPQRCQLHCLDAAFIEKFSYECLCCGSCRMV